MDSIIFQVGFNQDSHLCCCFPANKLVQFIYATHSTISANAIYGNKACMENDSGLIHGPSVFKNYS